MSRNLVIVESPAKAKTIEKFLGKDYTVKSSFGHVRDLAKKELGIDLENNYTPQYEVSDDKVTLVGELKKLADKADTVWLASDEDREGEAIAWHLYQVLELRPENTKRIVFHEITKNAILHAIENPRAIDMDIVNAQQARRVLDRLVGFELSPILWRKIKPSLSAGRVQSVAVRLIAEREMEIQKFQTEAYYRVVGDFSAENQSLRAELNDRLTLQSEVETLLESCRTAQFTVNAVEKKPGRRSPAAPFTTSTLQQEASRKLGMSVSQVMQVAQRLYEAGLITYMRTDSLNLSSQAIASAKAEIIDLYGEKYSHVRTYKTKSKGAQEAHEAIRPTYLDRRAVEGTAAEKRLYDLIWKRTVASQMSDALIEKTTAQITISSDTKHWFNAVGEVVTFDGFLKLYSESHDDDAPDNENKTLPKLFVGQQIDYTQIVASERFTSPAARYSEASLVKKLEDLGIGRPSTYAPTIATVINRGYVVRESRDGKSRGYMQWTLARGAIKTAQLSENYGSEKNKLFPTDVGLIVTEYLSKHFVDILDYNFTANVEKEFDEIAEGKLLWNQMIDRFYHTFHETVSEALEDKNRSNSTRELGVDPRSGKPVFARVGRFGPYVQLGESEESTGEKPQYANLIAGQLVATITLDEALRLFEMPRTLGDFEEKTVTVGIGRFGPYVRHDNKFVSLKKEDNPYTITLERAVDLIAEKRQAEILKHVKSFEEDPELQLLNGRWGVYIHYKGGNYKFPKDLDPKSVDYAQCLEIVQSQPEPKKSRFARKTTSEKKATSSSAAKGVAAKSSTKSTAKKTTAKRKTAATKK